MRPRGVAATAERLHLLPRYRQKLHRVKLHLSHPVRIDDLDFDVRFMYAT